MHCCNGLWHFHKLVQSGLHCRHICKWLSSQSTKGIWKPGNGKNGPRRILWNQKSSFWGLSGVGSDQKLEFGLAASMYVLRNVNITKTVTRRWEILNGIDEKKRLSGATGQVSTLAYYLQQKRRSFGLCIPLGQDSKGKHETDTMRLKQLDTHTNF